MLPSEILVSKHALASIPAVKGSFFEKAAETAVGNTAKNVSLTPDEFCVLTLLATDPPGFPPVVDCCAVNKDRVAFALATRLFLLDARQSPSLFFKLLVKNPHFGEFLEMLVDAIDNDIVATHVRAYMECTTTLFTPFHEVLQPVFVALATHYYYQSNSIYASSNMDSISPCLTLDSIRHLFEMECSSKKPVFKKLWKKWDPSWIDEKTGKTPLMLACEAKKGDLALSWIAQRGAEVHPSQVSCQGKTALICACAAGLADVAQRLIKMFKGDVLPSQTDHKQNNTALLLACLHGLEGVALLLVHVFGETVLPMHVSKDGSTALMLACAKRLSTISMTLINTFGVDVLPSQVNDKGQTVLIIACSSGLGKVATALITCFGIDVCPSQVDVEGDTALIWACRKKLDDVALVLMSTFGEDVLPSQVSNTGYTALSAACSTGLSSVAITLMDMFEADVNPMQVTVGGKTAFTLACERKMPDVVAGLVLLQFKQRK